VIALKTDFQNALNAIKVWAALTRHKQTRGILQAFYWQYSGKSPLLVYERGQLYQRLFSSNGVR
jgi:hypothetical protein